MECWQQQIREILCEQGGVEGTAAQRPADRQRLDRSGFSFVIGPGEVVNVTHVEICFLPSSQEKPGSGEGNCCLVDTQRLVIDRQAVLDNGGWVGEGIWVESNKSYVRRAISRCCSYWYAPAGARGVLATMPGYILALYDLLVYEYAHRYCLSGAGETASRTRLQGRQWVSQVKTTLVAQHCCGGVLFLQRFASGRPRRRGACIVLENAAYELRYLTMGGTAITHCLTCGKRLRETEMKAVSIYW